MSVKIKLLIANTSHGAKNFHIVTQSNKGKRVINKLGYYDSISKTGKVDRALIQEAIKNGAKFTPTAKFVCEKLSLTK